MMLVGLTGNIGSGKTTVSRLFSMLDVPVYHADEKGRHFLVLPEVQDKVISLFGEVVLDNNGKIDRKKLASVVFADKGKLRRLNEVIHPLVRKDFRQWAKKQAGHPYVME
ncbi:MAG: dephospho-CoA kinase, partial [Bacteroidales bacterium]